MSSPQTLTSTAVLDPDPGSDADPAPAVIIGPDIAPVADIDSAGPDQSAERPPNAWADFLPPQDLVIAENVRKQFDLADHPELLASIKEFGVETPVLVERQPDGSHHAIDGQLRVLGAVEVGTETVPVWVTDADPSIPENERRIRTTLKQMNVNHRRVPMTEADDAAGIALMLDLGASVTRIADGLQRTRSQVKKQAVVGASPTAKGLADAGTFTLDQLAVIAEYERLGDTNAVERLAAAPRYDFDFRARKIAHDRTEARARLHASLLYAALGLGVLTTEPDTIDTDARFLPVETLETMAAEPIGEELIRADAARWVVWVDVEQGADLVVRETGELLDPELVDWDTRGDSTREPATGLLHADTVERRDRWAPSYYLLGEQLPESGLRVRPVDIPDAQSGAGEQDSGEGISPAERTRQAAAAAAAERELARLERRRVRELNKQALAAAERREEFLTRLLRRSKPPTGAAAFVAQSLVGYPDLLDSARAALKARELLGTSDSARELSTAAGAMTPQRAQVITLALVLAAFESQIDKSFWRTSYGRHPRYLMFLADVAPQLPTADDQEPWTLTDVERAAAGLIDYRDIDLDV
ncbi:ParB N-terminal domain-containing protein [Nocardia sp. CA2R105]|uniref:ParB/RepB/Spo0J family partition protein n=1 Tax=Nocardia coffeae TaxID=2873381 RepID=UPI001CA7394C|nr:ParB N-terminal domain-containing protein [Nocardia coffeae]MBY8864040.1 ParB N-terminal domain-containing protein [Nocardia coffeae]